MSPSFKATVLLAVISSLAVMTKAAPTPEPLRYMCPSIHCGPQSVGRPPVQSVPPRAPQAPHPKKTRNQPRPSRSTNPRKPPRRQQTPASTQATSEIMINERDLEERKLSPCKPGTPNCGPGGTPIAPTAAHIPSVRRPSVVCKGINCPGTVPHTRRPRIPTTPCAGLSCGPSYPPKTVKFRELEDDLELELRDFDDDLEARDFDDDLEEREIELEIRRLPKSPVPSGKIRAPSFFSRPRPVNDISLACMGINCPGMAPLVKRDSTEMETRDDAGDVMLD